MARGAVQKRDRRVGQGQRKWARSPLQSGQSPFEAGTKILQKKPDFFCNSRQEKVFRRWIRSNGGLFVQSVQVGIDIFSVLHCSEFHREAVFEMTDNAAANVANPDGFADSRPNLGLDRGTGE